MSATFLAAGAIAPDIAKTASPQLVIRKTPDVARRPAERIPALDGLRGVAILLVLLRHSIAGMEPASHFWSAALTPLRLSWSGVDLFFVLSGFLIGGILFDVRHSPNYFRTFYIRRAFRILPVYAIVLMFYLGRHLPVRMVPGQLGDTSPLSIPWFSFVTFTQNFWMVPVGWFGPMAIAPTWSLAVEEQFYLTVPLLIRKVRLRTLYVFLTCVIVGLPFVRAVVPHLFTHGNFANVVLMPLRADALCLGVLCALAVRNARFRKIAGQLLWAGYMLIGAGLVSFFYLTYYGNTQFEPPMATWGFSSLALLYASVLMTAVCHPQAALAKVLCFAPLRRLGTIAYCTYLIHQPFTAAARRLMQIYLHLTPAENWASGGVIGVAIAIIVASLSWKYFEKPLLRVGHRYQY